MKVFVQELVKTSHAATNARMMEFCFKGLDLGE